MNEIRKTFATPMEKLAFDSGYREGIKELQSEINRLKKEKEFGDEALHERETLIVAFDQIRKCFEGRTWLMDGRGLYPYNDDRYKEEVRYILDEFNNISSNMWRQINSKTFEYRDLIQKPLLEEIERLNSFSNNGLNR